MLRLLISSSFLFMLAALFSTAHAQDALPATTEVTYLATCIKDTVAGKAKAKYGLYYGVGGGVNYNNVNVELMYKENQGQYKVGSSKADADYKRVTLGVGYDFNLGK